MFELPTVEEVKNCTEAFVHLKTNGEKHDVVRINGIFQEFKQTDNSISIKTNFQYATFQLKDVSAIHFCK